MSYVISLKHVLYYKAIILSIYFQKNADGLKSKEIIILDPNVRMP